MWVLNEPGGVDDRVSLSVGGRMVRESRGDGCCAASRLADVSSAALSARGEAMQCAGSVDRVLLRTTQDLGGAKVTKEAFQRWTRQWLAMFAGGILSLSAAASPTHLQVNRSVDPLGVDDPEPSLSWQSDSTARNWQQSAYRIQVASSLKQLRTGHADVWDSGRVASAESVGIRYAGKPLVGQKQYFWQVRTWSATGSEESSQPAHWETGLMGEQAWTAKWIGADHAAERALLARVKWLWLPGADALHVPGRQAAEFRYRLHVDQVPQAAVLHVLTGGTFLVDVNGQVTGHKQEWGAFDREDIGAALHEGDNEVVIHTTARGADAGKTTADAVAAVLELRGQDGRETQVVSDAQWQARRSGGDRWQVAEAVGGLSDLRVNVGSDRREMEAAPDRLTTGVALLRKPFALVAPVRSARLYVTAMGAYRASLNGRRVGSTELAPGFTDFRKRVLYQTYDVTALVHPGKNVMGAMLAGGWHSSPLLWSGVREFDGPDALRAQLVVTYTNGRKTVLATDDTWHGEDSATGSAEIYGGESYDARLAVPGWDLPAFAEERSWLPVVQVPVAGTVHVTAQPDLPMHVSQEVQPLQTTPLSGPGAEAGTFLVDMGQNMVGNVRLHVQGKRGTVVRLQFAERLKADGSVYTENLRNADATDEFTLAGGGPEEWQPAFTFHGFRYVQISGLPVGSAAPRIVGEVINSLPDKPSMRFTSSSETLNSMFELGLWGQRGNYVSVPTDCPQRDERMGWMGDAGVFWRTGSYNFNVDSFSHKFMDDVDDAQTPEGIYPNIAPNLLLVGTEATGAPGWGDAGVLVPYATWMQYGDRRIIDQHWEDMQRWMQWIAKHNPDGLRVNDLGPNYADWLAPDPKTPSDLVATAYWALLAQQMEAMARATGRNAEAQEYRATYGKIRLAFAKAYLHADGTVKGGTQTAYLLALYTGMAEASEQRGLTDKLVADIEAHGNHLTTGFLGTPFLLFVLDQQGRTDVAYRLLLNDTYPSWGYMVKKGATTWWERWNGDTGDPGMNSYNHYAFGSVMAWVYRRVAGIDTDASGAGFQHLTIAPQLDKALTHAHAEYDSAYGTVTTDWAYTSDNEVRLRVSLPANTTAAVTLPDFGSHTMTQDGAPMTTRTVSVGSGVSVFQLR